MRLLVLFALGALAFAQQQQPAKADPTKDPIVLKVSGMERVQVRKDVVYSTPDGQPQKADIYIPAGAKRTDKFPALVLISGADRAKDWGFYTSFGRVAAAQGFVAVPYDKRYPRGTAGVNTGVIDTLELLRFLRAHAADYNIDGDCIVMWGFSAGGGILTPFLRRDKEGVRAYVHYYAISDFSPYMKDAPADQQERARNASGAALIQETDLARILPMFVVRAGQDDARLNQGIDALVAAALAKNADLTFINYRDGHHGFDIFDDNDRSREILRETFDWVRARVGK
jgi:acetyl esterase/lipase